MNKALVQLKVRDYMDGFTDYVADWLTFVASKAELFEFFRQMSQLELPLEPLATMLNEREGQRVESL